MSDPKNAQELLTYIQSEIPTNDAREITAVNVQNCFTETANSMMAHELHHTETLDPPAESFDIDPLLLQDLPAGKYLTMITVFYDPAGASGCRLNVKKDTLATPLRSSCPDNGKFVNATAYIEHPNPASAVMEILMLADSGTPLIQAFDLQMIRLAGT